MVVDTKLYDCLNVSPNASMQEIKKEYRKLALRFHPDKNPDGKERFREISHAYSILSDEEKRQAYDRFGTEDMDQGTGHGSGFESFFGGSVFDEFFGGGRAKQRGPKKGKPITHRISLTLEELFLGKKSVFKIKRDRLCVECDGKGGKDVFVCKTCNGNGVILKTIRQGNFMQQYQTACDRCLGKGKTVGVTCKTCSGRCVTKESKKFEVIIEKGMKAKQTIVFEGESDQEPGTLAGDIIFVVDEQPHKKFKRVGNDLVCSKEIDLSRALTGGICEIIHLDKRQLYINLSKGDPIKHDDIRKINNEGMPEYGRSFSKGYLYVQFKIVYPPKEWFTFQKTTALEAALPKKEIINLCSDATEVHAAKVDQKTFSQNTMNEESDEEEEQQQGTRCTTQ